MDGDGWIDIVCGGEWYRNSRKVGVSFKKIVFDPELKGIHDIVAADVSFCGKPEIITMSNQKDLPWYMELLYAAKLSESEGGVHDALLSGAIDIYVERLTIRRHYHQDIPCCSCLVKEE